MIPIDEMLDCLRNALDAFDANPCDDTFAKVQHETWRIESACEDEMLEAEGDDE